MSEYADLFYYQTVFLQPQRKYLSLDISPSKMTGYFLSEKDWLLSEIIGTNTKYLDYGNKTITPGFSDVHCFFTGYSVGFVGIDLSAATSQEEILIFN